MALRDQPYIPLYIQDYLTDEKLNECSAATQGIYIKIMCIMHKSETYGKILLKQKYKQIEGKCCAFATQFVKHLNFTHAEIYDALLELTEEGVLHFDSDFICQKRMIKDNELSLKRSEAGKKGGKFSQFAKAKTQSNPENEIVNEIVNENINKDESEVEVWPTFKDFWNAYDKKVGPKDKCKKKFDKLNQDVREQIMNHLFYYVKATPNKQYRLNPETFLNQKGWENEIINNNEKGTKQGFVERVGQYYESVDPNYKNL